MIIVPDLMIPNRHESTVGRNLLATTPHRDNKGFGRGQDITSSKSRRHDNVTKMKVGIFHRTTDTTTTVTFRTAPEGTNEMCEQ